MKKFDPTKIHIGLVRYADHFHPTNETSERRWEELTTKAVGAKCTVDLNAQTVKTWKKIARNFGYELHTFEKGLGR